MTEPEPFDRYILGRFDAPPPVYFKQRFMIPPVAFPTLSPAIFESVCRAERLLRVALLRRSPWAAYDRTPEVLAEVAAVLPRDEARLVLQAGEPSGGAA